MVVLSASVLALGSELGQNWIEGLGQHSCFSGLFLTKLSGFCPGGKAVTTGIFSADRTGVGYLSVVVAENTQTSV